MGAAKRTLRPFGLSVMERALGTLAKRPISNPGGRCTLFEGRFSAAVAAVLAPAPAAIISSIDNAIKANFQDAIGRYYLGFEV